MSYIVVITTVDDRQQAQSLAEKAVELGLAACVQIVGPVQSVYRWKGNVETANEFRVEMKTTSSHYSRIKAFIQEVHPYEVPEIISLPIQDIASDYGRWLDEQLGSE